MSFGQHFENTILGFVDKVDDMIKRNHEWNEESKALGLVSDEEKLKLLKAQLYRVATAGKMGDNLELQRLTSAIETLEEIKANKIKHRYSLPVQLEIFTNTVILFSISLVAGSFLASHQCGDYQSQFCSNARVIPTQITRFYYNYFFR